MPWHDAATDEEKAELARLREARDAARDEYNAFYRVLMKRCQSRIRYAAIKDREARE
jgi:hypothetical protein